MRAYLDLCQRIVEQGTWVENERTGKRCLTVINADLEYNVGGNEFPMITTRKSFFKSAIAVSSEYPCSAIDLIRYSGRGTASSYSISDILRKLKFICNNYFMGLFLKSKYIPRRSAVGTTELLYARDY